jgi:hypothetical protein
MRLSRHLVFCALAFNTISLDSRGAEPTIENIRDAFSTHLQGLDHLYVHWRRSSDYFRNKAGAFVNQDCRSAIKGDMRFYDITLDDFQGSPMDGRTRRRAMSFDGEETRILLFAGHARVYPIDRREQFDAPDDFLALQGYPKSQYRIRFNKKTFNCNLAEMLRRQDYELRGTEEINGKKCVKIVGPADRIFVDPERGYAIVRRELFDGQPGSVGTRYSFQDFIQAKAGLWLARKIVSEHFDGSQLVHRRTLKALELDLDEVPDSLFSLTFDPGTTITDVRHASRNDDGSWPIVNYRIPADPANLDKVVAGAAERLKRYDLEAKRGQSVRLILLAVNVVMIIVIGAVLVKRYMKTAQ